MDTDPYTQKTIDLMVAGLDEALYYLNMEAQRRLLGLDEVADEVRQAVAIGLSAARGGVLVGNLRRAGEIREAIKYTASVAPFPTED